ncbi:RNA-binding protein 48 [Drosophila innubila]|uniref:RNA-binding protein 48 n=1 Tax=Drosophila innubila TaxID=198719 RepID=UPI00148B8825|nr:RNA-binding protein 48 [Drosophila innubila]
MEPTPAEHHKRFAYCTTRLQYRQGRELKAVKVYTVASESRHLLVFGVPKVNLHTNIKNKMQCFGKLQSCTCVSNELAKKMELEAFTDVFAVQFERLEQARRAKRQLDAKQFFGGILHISYAPERETPQELREKFQQRQREIAQRIKRNLAEQPPAAKQKNKDA